MSSRRLSKAEIAADVTIRKALRERIRDIMRKRDMSIDSLVDEMRRNGMKVGRQSLFGWLYQLSPPLYALPVLAKCFGMRDYRRLLPEVPERSVDKQTNC